jgi:uncharacterized membrane protein YphA (DoxX/SURF4 family)
MHTLAIIGQVLFGFYWLNAGINHFRKLPALTGYAASKGTPAPKLAVVGSGLLLLIGGVGILLGYQLWWAILFLVVFLLGVTPTMHKFWADTDPQAKMNNHIQFMKNLALLGALLMLWSSSMLAYSLI